MNVNTLFPFFGLVFSTTAAFAEDLQPTTLTVGVNYSVDFQSYKGQRTYQSVLPTVFFDNDKFYAEGDEAGIYLLNNDKNQLRLNAYYDGSSYDPSGELKGLDQRKWSVMAGGSYMRITPYGGLKAQLGTDVLSRSKGTVGTVSYVAELKHDQWSFYPEFGLQWNDAKYNQYYYGVSDKESKRTHIQAYQAKQSISPFASLAANYTFSKHWSAFSTLEVNYLSSYVYNDQGTPFLDLQMWYSAVNFGYKNPRLDQALINQIHTLPQIASQYLHPTKIELSKVIAEDMLAKTGVKGRIHFNVGGSQSIEDSLKLVRNFTHGKSRMFAFEGGYHGRTLGASSITSSYRYRRRYGHFGERAQFIPFPYPFRRPKGMTPEEYAVKLVAEFKRLFENEYHGVWDPKVRESEFAAFYIETIQGTGGYVIPPMNFYPELKKVLDDHGILLVVDEVQMGFYRTGKLWSFEHFGITPDVLVFGKALTNGLNPLAGVWAKEEMINPEVFPVGSTHSTFASNPLGTAVGLEVMKMLAEKDYEKQIMESGAYFLEGLKELQKRHPEIGDVDGLGLALRAEICEADGFTPNKALLDKMVDIGLSGTLEYQGEKCGLVLDVGGYYKNVITFAPNLEISRAEIDQAMVLLEQLLNRAKKEI